MTTSVLKKMSPRHKEIARRCLVGETPEEISEDLGMHQGSIVWMMNQDVFKQHLGQLEYETERRLTNAQERLDVLGILANAEQDAAELVVDIMNDKVVSGEAQVGTGLRLKSAWDILDRRGYKAVEKKMTVSLSDLIIAARDEAKAKEEPVDVTSAEGS